MKYLSFGAGVQSTALLAMSNNGDCKRADVAIFADTQDEPQWVYDTLEWAKKWSKIPIEIATAGRLSEGWGQGWKRFCSIPAYSGNGTGLLRRQCTREYKIDPIQKKVRELMGYKKGQRIKEKAVCMIGISVDEAQRMKPSRERWIENTWPLIDAGMRREDCHIYLTERNLPTPKKSSCIYCPFHSDAAWKDLKQNHPKEWERIIDADKRIRRMGMKVEEDMYLHRSCKPIDEVDFNEDQMDFFGNECDGYCGV